MGGWHVPEVRSFATWFEGEKIEHGHCFSSLFGRKITDPIFEFRTQFQALRIVLHSFPGLVFTQLRHACRVWMQELFVTSMEILKHTRRHSSRDVPFLLYEFLEV